MEDGYNILEVCGPSFGDKSSSQWGYEAAGQSVVVHPDLNRKFILNETIKIIKSGIMFVY